MSLRAIADTHTIIWYMYGDARLSAAGRLEIDSAAADGEQIGVSTISLVEIVYLAEKGRIAANVPDDILAVLHDPIPLLLEIPVDRTIVAALRRVDRVQVPELADRVIAATAHHFGLPVISRDRKITASVIPTIW
ncbi:MAG: type II toxin-antitoxin system VapC family toxin [Chloroflexaceae bacterium]